MDIKINTFKESGNFYTEWDTTLPTYIDPYDNPLIQSYLEKTYPNLKGFNYTYTIEDETFYNSRLILNL